MENDNKEIRKEIFDEVKSHIEALLFASDEPIPLKLLNEILSDFFKAGKSEVDELNFSNEVTRKFISELNQRYKDNKQSFHIIEIAGGFQFATLPKFARCLGLLFKEKAKRRLSQSALETLAIIAFKQPISKPDIENIRGVNSDYVLSTLLEKNLVAIVGRAETVGRPLLYGTSKDFLKHFGLKDITDLPKLKEVEEIMNSDEFKDEVRRLESSLLKGNVEETEEVEDLEKSDQYVTETGEIITSEEIKEPGQTTEENMLTVPPEQSPVDGIEEIKTEQSLTQSEEESEKILNLPEESVEKIDGNLQDDTIQQEKTDEEIMPEDETAESMEDKQEDKLLHGDTETPLEELVSEMIGENGDDDDEDEENENEDDEFDEEESAEDTIASYFPEEKSEKSLDEEEKTERIIEDQTLPETSESLISDEQISSEDGKGTAEDNEISLDDEGELKKKIITEKTDQNISDNKSEILSQTRISQETLNEERELQKSDASAIPDDQFISGISEETPLLDFFPGAGEKDGPILNKELDETFLPIDPQKVDDNYLNEVKKLLDAEEMVTNTQELLKSTKVTDEYSEFVPEIDQQSINIKDESQEKIKEEISEDASIEMPERISEIEPDTEPIETEIREEISEDASIEMPERISDIKLVTEPAEIETQTEIKEEILEETPIEMPERISEIEPVTESIEIEIKEEISEDAPIEMPEIKSEIELDTEPLEIEIKEEILEEIPIELPEKISEIEPDTEPIETEIREEISEDASIESPERISEIEPVTELTETEIKEEISEEAPIELPEIKSEIEPVTESVEIEIKDDISEDAPIYMPERISDIEPVTESVEIEIKEEISEDAPIYMPERISDIEPVTESIEIEIKEDFSEDTPVELPERISDIEPVTEPTEIEIKEEISEAVPVELPEIKSDIEPVTELTETEIKEEISEDAPIELLEIKSDIESVIESTEIEIKAEILENKPIESTPAIISETKSIDKIEKRIKNLTGISTFSIANYINTEDLQKLILSEESIAPSDKLKKIEEKEKKKQERKAEFQRQKEIRISQMRQAEEKVKEKKEMESRLKSELERKAKEESKRRAKEETERRAKEESKRRAKEELERRAKEELERRAKEESKRRAKEELERKAKEELERRAKEELERRAKEELERKAKEEAECKFQEENEVTSLDVEFKSEKGHEQEKIPQQEKKEQQTKVEVTIEGSEPLKDIEIDKTLAEDINEIYEKEKSISLTSIDGLGTESISQPVTFDEKTFFKKIAIRFKIYLKKVKKIFSFIANIFRKRND